MEIPWSGTDEAQRGAAENGVVDSGSDEPQDQSAAPEDEAVADEALLDFARAGDEQSYAVLYERHRSTALNVARMHTRNVHDAEDLVSEAFARILSILRRGGGPRKYMRSYLVATIGRLAVDHGMGAGRVRPSGDDAELDRVCASTDSTASGRSSSGSSASRAPTRPGCRTTRTGSRRSR